MNSLAGRLVTAIVRSIYDPITYVQMPQRSLARAAAYLLLLTVLLASIRTLVSAAVFHQAVDNAVQEIGRAHV